MAWSVCYRSVLWFGVCGVIAFTLPVWADDVTAATVTIPITGITPVNPDQRKAQNDLKDHREAVRQADEDYQAALQGTGANSVQTREAKAKLDQQQKDLEKVIYEQGKVHWPTPPPTVSPDSKSPANPNDPLPPARQVTF